MADCCEHGNEPSYFIKCGEFIDYLGDYHPLKKKQAHYNCTCCYFIKCIYHLP
jgi:hypothetical protein